MGWQSDVATGYCQVLDAAGVCTWSPDVAVDTLTDADCPISRGPITPTPTKQVGVQTYRAGADDPANPTTTLRIQFWLRAATVDELDDLDQAIYDAVHGLADVTMGAAQVTDTQSFNSIPMGVDDHGNPERACNYTVQLDLPDTALRAN